MYCSLVRRDFVLPWKLMMSNYYWIQERSRDEEQNAETSQSMELSKIVRTKLGATLTTFFLSLESNTNQQASVVARWSVVSQPI